MKKCIYVVLMLLVATSCNSSLKKQLKNDIKKAQTELEQTRAEYSDVCNQVLECQKTIKDLSDSVEVLRSVSHQLDSVISELNLTLNPKRSQGSSVIVF